MVINRGSDGQECTGIYFWLYEQPHESHQLDSGRGKQEGGSKLFDSVQELQDIQFFLWQRPILSMMHDLPIT